MTKVKICGLTNLEDARKAEDLGADFLGFIFFEKTPRAMSPDAILNIIHKLHDHTQKVGLFLDQDINYVKDQARVCCLDVVQLHGTESPQYVSELKKEFNIIKTFRIKKEFDFSILETYKMADFYLFDTFKHDSPGGTGIAFDWNILEGQSFAKPIFLAGGLNPANVGEAIEKVRPYAVDVASGVEEAPGKKDYKLLEEFIHAAK